MKKANKSNHYECKYLKNVYYLMNSSKGWSNNIDLLTSFQHLFDNNFVQSIKKLLLL
jgi:hypothetical protein